MKTVPKTDGIKRRDSLILAAALAVVAPVSARADSFDWRNVGGQSYLTAVQDQDPAGTCWAFASTADLEAMYLLTRIDPSYQVALSEQNLVCPQTMGSTGGGSQDEALNYFTSTGIVTAAELPYTAENTSPDWPLQPGWQSRVFMSASNTNGLASNTASIKAELKAYGPLTVGISANDLNTTTYGTDSADHSVLIVGYVDSSTYPGGGYWIIKNSWGATWNGNGYGTVMYGNVERQNWVDAITGQAYYVGSMGTLNWASTAGGTWSTTATSWLNNGSSAVWSNGEYTGVFASPATGGATVTVGNVSAHELDINSGATGYTFTGGKLLVTGGGINDQENCTINSTIALGMTQTWNVASGKTLTVGGNVMMHINALTILSNGQTTINGVLEDVQSDPNFTGLLTGYHPALTMTGTGVLALNAADLYTGNTRVSSGTLQIGQPLALQDSTLDMNSADSGSVVFVPSTATLGGLTGARNLALPAGFTSLSIGNNNNNTSYSGQLSGGAGVIKLGSGVLTLTGTDVYSGTTTISGGMLGLNSATALPGGIGISGGTSGLTLNGGVVGLENGDFTRGLGSGSTQVQWTGSGGFAAVGANHVVNLGNTGATLTWGSGSFVPNGSALILGNVADDHMVDFQNPINLDSSAHTVEVDQGTADIDGQLSGSLSGSAPLTKTGTGMLSLTGNNVSQSGGWNVLAGGLAVSSDSALGTGGLTFGNATTLRLTGTAVFASSKTIIVNASTTLDVRTTAGATLLGSISGSGGLTKVGSATLTLASANSFTGPTTITTGTLSVANSRALQYSTVGTSNSSTLNFSGIGNAVLGGLSGNGTLALPGSFALTVGANNSSTNCGGSISGTSASLTKAGSGTFNLTGANFYTGGTTLTNGTLNACCNSLGTGGLYLAAGGTLNLNGNAGCVPGVNGLSAQYYINTNSNHLTSNSLAALPSYLAPFTRSFSNNIAANVIGGNFDFGSNGSAFPTGSPGIETIQNFAAEYSGYFYAATVGTYTFQTYSDDGSMLWFNNADTAVSQDGGGHGMQDSSNTGVVVSAPGYYPITVAYDQGGGGYGLQVSYEAPGTSSFSLLPISMLYAAPTFFTASQTTLAHLSGAGNLVLGSGSSLAVGTDNFSETFSGVISGPGSLIKIGSGVLTLSSASTYADNTYSGGTNVSGGTLVLASSNAFPANTSLIVESGAQVIVPNHGGNPTSVAVVSTLTNSGTIDITNNAMLIHSGLVGTVTAEVAAAYNGGRWNGTTGSVGVITSSTAAGDTTHLTAIGVATGLAVFQGSGVSNSDVLIKYTYYGDANLDGKVDGSDYSRIDAAYLTDKSNPSAMTGWYNGDFNYDGAVNGSDYTLIDNAFNTQGAQLSASIAGANAVVTAQIAAVTAVPEPVGMLALALVWPLCRRRGTERR